MVRTLTSVMLQNMLGWSGVFFGNLPTILARFTAHKNALGAILHTGMARSHRGNPAASLHVHTVYAAPILFSGIAPLVLSDYETYLVNQNHK